VPEEPAAPAEPAAAEPEAPVPAAPAAPVPAPESPCVLFTAFASRGPVVLQSAGSVACFVLSQRSPMFLSFAACFRGLSVEELSLDIVSFAYDAFTKPERAAAVPLILLADPEVEDWVSLSLEEVLLLLFFFDLLLELLSADWSLDEALLSELPDFWPELLVSLEEALGTDEEELPFSDELPFDVVSVEELGVEEELDELPGLIEPEPDAPDVDAAPLYCDEEPDDGLCVLPLL
jgi:hypothetical protein